MVNDSKEPITSDDGDRIALEPNDLTLISSRREEAKKATTERKP